MRLTVQFQSVLETFTPHDTVFSFSVASELNESALGLCTMLLPSPASLTSSSSSLRRRRLNEITEDAEEAAVPAEEKEIHEPQPEEATTNYGRRELDELPASAVLAKALLAKRKEEAAAATSTNNANADADNRPVVEENSRPLRIDSLPPAKPSVSPLPPSIADKALPATPESTPPTTSEGIPPKAPDFDTTSNLLLEATTAKVDPTESASPRSPHTRHLSAAESDSISQWSTNVSSYTTSKPKKKKLGPRPHVETVSRPKTSGTTDSSLNGRPIANLPTSIRVNNRSLVSLALRPGSQQSSRSVPGRFAPSSLLMNGAPPLPPASHLQSLYKAGESHTTLSRPASVTGDGSSTTPEKLRLMKALQLRKRNMLLAQRASASNPPLAPVHIHNVSESSLSSNPSSNQSESIASREQLSNIDEESKLTQSSNTTSPTTMTNVSEEPSTTASSFTEQDDTSRKRRSLSSATSSSITPKALVQETQRPSQVDDVVDDARPSSNSGTASSMDKARDKPEASPEEASITSEESPEIYKDPRDNDAEPQPSDGDSQPNLAVQQFASLPEEDALPLRSTSQSPTKSKRNGPPPPLQILPGGDASASEVSEDDSLMDELQNATVHEAKPVSVARSPVTPIMSKGSSDRLREMIIKLPNPTPMPRPSASSTPDRDRTSSLRSLSTALPQWPPVPAEPIQIPLSKKPTLGTGISKRIKALEVLTAKDANLVQAPPPVRDTSAGRSAFSAFMKRSSFVTNHPQAPNASTESSPPKQLPASRSLYEPGASPATKDLRRTSSDTQRALQKGETISVTARIIRDPSNKHPPAAPSSNYHSPLNLYRSPLIVEHEKHDQPNFDPALASMQAATKSPSSKSERGRFSFSSHRSGSQTNLPRSESNNSKMSHGSKKHGPRSASDAASISEDKAKSSMTSRLMKRMSNLTSSRRGGQHVSKDEPHPTTIQEQSEHTRENSIAESLLQVVDIGDVNVQFPESLLWKRRFMRIDDQGYLIFSPPMTDANMRSVSRKYHLSEFKRPSLPDLEREEMACSVLLDLKDGRCIQCACENKQAQQQVLQSKSLKCLHNND